MDEIKRGRLKRQIAWRRLKKLGVSNTHCICGQNDPVCFEVEHPFRRAFDKGVVLGTCVSCHRIKSAWENAVNPPINLHLGNPFARLGHRFAGMSFYSRFIADKLEEDAELMFRLAAKGQSFGD